MRKSIPPNSFTHRSAASCRLSTLLTSILPIPNTLAPDRAVAMSFATSSVFCALRPTMQALAPRWTRARTCAEQMLPLPPVQKTTLSAKRLSRQTAERYSERGRGMALAGVVEKRRLRGVGDMNLFGRDVKGDKVCKGRTIDVYLAINGRKTVISRGGTRRSKRCSSERGKSCERSARVFDYRTCLGCCILSYR
jgi:hypothetical protein